jgi:hypothetical protein
VLGALPEIVELFYRARFGARPLEPRETETIEAFVAGLRQDSRATS